MNATEKATLIELITNSDLNYKDDIETIRKTLDRIERRNKREIEKAWQRKVEPKKVEEKQIYLYHDTDKNQLRRRFLENETDEKLRPSAIETITSYVFNNDIEIHNYKVICNETKKTHLQIKYRNTNDNKLKTNKFKFL